MKVIKRKTVKKTLLFDAEKKPVKKAPTKKAIAKKKPIKKVPVKKIEPKIIPAKKWDEGGVDFIKKTYNRLNKSYSVNIANTTGVSLFGVGKTLVEPKRVNKKKDLTFNDKISPKASGKRDIKLLVTRDFSKKINNKSEESFRTKFELKSNGKYNIGKLKGLNIVNKDGYAPLKVLILTFTKDEIKLLKNGLPIKFILEK